MKRFIIILILTHFALAGSFAQSVISGKIFDAKTNEAVASVGIVNALDGSGTTSNKDGFFSIAVQPDQPVTLTFLHVGFHPFEKQFSPKDFNIGQRIILKQKVEQLSEVEIMGVSTIDKAYRTEDVEIKTLEKSNLNDIGDLLRNVPNMSGVKKGAVGIDPVLRGFKYSQLNVQLNGGTRIEGGCPNRMDPATAHVDLNDVKHIKILKGPFALKYGVNFAGVVDMTTYQPEFYEKYKTHVNVLLGGQTNHTGFKTKVGVSGASRIVTYNMTGSWKKYGDYKDGNGDWVPASLQHQTYTGNLGFRISKKHIIYASADISQGSNIDFPTLPMDERKDDTKLYSLNYLANNIGNSINFIRFKAYYSDVNHEMDNKNRPFSDTMVAVSKIHAINSGGKFGINLKVGQAQLEVGGDYENITKDGTRLKTLIMQPMLPSKEEDLWNTAHIRNLGFFAEYHRPGQVIDWTAAARFDVNNATSGSLTRKNMAGDAVYSNDSTTSHYNNFSVSGGLSWHISKSSDLFFSLGRGVRSPDMTERFIILLPVGYDPYDYIGNPQLKPEANNEIDLGYRFRNPSAGNIEISVFFSYVTNYITGVLVPPSEIKPQTKGVLGVKRFINIDKAFMTGFEISYRTPAKFLWEINFNAAYTMGWNPEVKGVIFVDGVARVQVIKNDPLPEIPPFETYISFNYKLFKRKFVPAVSLRVAAAQNRVSEAYNEQATPGFVTVSLDIKYQFNNFLKVYAGIKNLFDRPYYEHLNRNIIGAKYPLYEPGRIFYANLIFNF